MDPRRSGRTSTSSTCYRYRLFGLLTFVIRKDTWAMGPVSSKTIAPQRTQRYPLGLAQGALGASTRDPVTPGRTCNCRSHILGIPAPARDGLAIFPFLASYDAVTTYFGRLKGATSTLLILGWALVNATESRRTIKYAVALGKVVRGPCVSLARW